MAIRSLKSGSFSRSTQVGNSIILPGDYESIATATVGVGGTSSVTFSSIPQTFTHLQIRMIARCDRAVAYANSVYGRFNSDSTAANYYDMHQVYGDGTSATAYAYSGGGNSFFGGAYGSSTLANTFSVSIIDILDYTNTNKYKTIRSLKGDDSNSGNTNSTIYLSSSLWKSTSAINSIQIITTGAGNSYNFTQYSHFALYGIRG